MRESFRLSGLDHRLFAAFFEMSDEALARHGAVRRRATQAHGFPCRVSLEDARVGDELILLPFTHQPADSPYRASGPIFVRRDARQAVLAAGVVPDYVASRLISLRAYDRDDLMIDADVVDGSKVGQALDEVLRCDRVAYVHLHNAKRGCFSCRADRV